MSDPVIIDAGPALNFFATNNQRILFTVLPYLCAPEVVDAEVRRKAKEERFSAAERVWGRLQAAATPRLEILSDTPTTLLAQAAQRVTRGSLWAVQAESKDQGETMVVIHADALAFQGKAATVIIDDGGGQRLASRTIARIDRARALRPDLGSVRLIDTPWILRAAARDGAIPDRAAMRTLYTRLREMDNGLMPIDRTDLLNISVWG